MPGRIFAAIKRVTGYIVRFVQEILLAVLLTLIYFVLFGLTYLSALVFRRDLLWPKGGGAGWVEATGYAPDLDAAKRQS